MIDPYEPGLRILILMIGVFAILLCCSGCAGFTDNAKQIRIQIPALLDVEFEYNDRKGKSQPSELKGLIPTKD